MCCIALDTVRRIVGGVRHVIPTVALKQGLTADLPRELKILSGVGVDCEARAVCVDG